MDDDSDDSSSPTETLDQFREKWQKELSTTKHNQKQTATPSSASDPTGRKDVSAQKLFSFPERLITQSIYLLTTFSFSFLPRLG